MSIHGVGGQIGDSIGPLVVGGLLTLFNDAWRRVALVYVFPALLMTGVVWWALFRLGGGDADSTNQVSVGQRFRDAGRLLRNPAILSLVLVSSLRDMGSGSLIIWLPKYLLDPVEAGGLAMTPFLVGLHLTLLLILGVVSSPIAGILSDRYGRKLILIPCLTAVGLLSLVLGQVEAGPVLIAIVLAIGLFSSSMNQILQATVLDQIGRGTEGVTLGIVMGVNSALSAVAPLLAVLVVDAYGLSAVFIYTAALWVAGAAFLVFTPLRPPPGVTAPDNRI